MLSVLHVWPGLLLSVLLELSHPGGGRGCSWCLETASHIKGGARRAYVSARSMQIHCVRPALTAGRASIWQWAVWAS